MILPALRRHTRNDSTCGYSRCEVTSAEQSEGMGRQPAVNADSCDRRPLPVLLLCDFPKKITHASRFGAPNTLSSYCDFHTLRRICAPSGNHVDLRRHRIPLRQSAIPLQRRPAIPGLFPWDCPCLRATIRIDTELSPFSLHLTNPSGCPPCFIENFKFSSLYFAN
jgi:hypothetical protein